LIFISGMDSQVKIDAKLGPFGLSVFIKGEILDKKI